MRASCWCVCPPPIAPSRTRPRVSSRRHCSHGFASTQSGLLVVVGYLVGNPHLHHRARVPQGWDRTRWCAGALWLCMGMTTQVFAVWRLIFNVSKCVVVQSAFWMALAALFSLFGIIHSVDESSEQPQLAIAKVSCPMLCPLQWPVGHDANTRLLLLLVCHRAERGASSAVHAHVRASCRRAGRPAHSGRPWLLHGVCRRVLTARAAV